MCKNAQKTVIDLLATIEPTILSLGKQAGLENNPLFKTVIDEYNAALTAVENWTSGTPSQDVIQVINALESAVAFLPIPPAMQTLVNIILAGIATVIGVISANSPAPTPIPRPLGDANVEETQAQHQAEVIHETTIKVQKLVPNFKRSIWHAPATQYKNTWNSEVERHGLPETLKVA